MLRRNIVRSWSQTTMASSFVLFPFLIPSQGHHFVKLVKSLICLVTAVNCSIVIIGMRCIGYRHRSKKSFAP